MAKSLSTEVTMPTINQLSAVTSVVASDLLPLYSSANGDARKASMSVVLDFIEANFGSPEFTTIINAPTLSGFNILLAAATSNLWLIINPTGPFAAGTITLPPVASCYDGQQIIVVCSQSITTLTLAGNGATIVGTPGALGTGGFFALRFNTLQSAWYCVSQSLGALGTSFSSITLTDIPASIKDQFGNTLLELAAETASAVNYVLLTAKPTGNSPSILARGSDTNVNLLVASKGGGNLTLSTGTGNLLVTTSGTAVINGDIIVTSDASQTLTNKTLTGPITDAIKTGGVGTSTVALVALAYPAATSKGFRTVVVDATQALTAGIGAVVAGGGANCVPVYSDGTNWRIG
jgi:hypothetical protein